MEHSFDIEVAKKYGITEAVLLKNFYFWIEKNRTNNLNYFDGKYWTYNSRKRGEVYEGITRSIYPFRLGHFPPYLGKRCSVSKKDGWCYWF